MTNSNCNCKFDCTLLSITASIIIGITTAILRYTAIIAQTPAFLWVTLGIGVGFLALAFLKPTQCCADSCKKLPLILVILGALGTILASIVLLAITFAATSVLGAIILGGLLGFLSLTLSGAACYIKKAEDCCD